MAYTAQHWSSPNARRKPANAVRFDLASITLGLALCAFPISAMLSAATGVFEDTLSIASRAITVLAAFLLFAKRLTEGRLSVPHWAFLGFMAAYCARLAWDYYVEKLPEVGSSAFFFIVTAVVPALALGSVRARDWDEEKASRTMFVFSAVFVLIAIWVLVIRGSEFATADQLSSTGGRHSLERLNSIYLGTMAASSFLFATSSFLHERSTKWRAFAGMIAVLSFYVVILAGSRGPIVGVLFCLTIMFGLNTKGLLLGIALAAIIGVMTALSLIDWTRILEQLRFSDIGEDVNSLSRFDLMSEGIFAFAQSPLVGYSFNLPFSGSWPHNIFVEILMATGLVGMAVFVTLLLPALVRAVRRLKFGSSVTSLLLLQYFIGFQFSGTLWGGSTLWIALAMVSAKLVPERQRSEAYRRPTREKYGAENFGYNANFRR